MQKRLDEVLDEVDSNIQQNAARGETIDLAEIINEGYNREIANGKYDLGSTGKLQELEEALNKTLDEFGREVPIDEALKFRRSTDKNLANFWKKIEDGKGGFSNQAHLDATKEVSNVLREKLNSYSNNAQLNREASELLTLIPHLEKRIVLGRNKNLLPFGSGEVIAASRAMGGNVGGASLILTGTKLLEASPVKAYMARKLRAGRTAGPTKRQKYSLLTQAAIKTGNIREEK